MEQKKTWQKADNSYFLRDISSTEDTLKKGVYELRAMPVTGELYLAKIEDTFKFEFKIYGLERSFINRVLKTYQHTKGNLGVLLNGVKGTGKSITAEIIANESQLPVILVTRPYGGLNSFITSITQDVCVFIDEYEKIYKNSNSFDDDEEGSSKGDSSLLSLMDGVLKTDYRRMFLLTTNRMWINENMLNRPGRIRYLKNFSDLNLEQIKEIVGDCLVNTKWTDDVFAFLKPLKLITVDIVKTIINQVNIFDESPETCCKDLNLEFKSDVYNIIKIVEGREEGVIMQEDVPLTSVNSFETTAKRSPKLAQIYVDSVTYRCNGIPDKGVYSVYDVYNPEGEKSAINIRFQKAKGYHSVFV